MKESDFILTQEKLSATEKDIFFHLATNKAVNMKSAVWVSTILRSRKQYNKFYKRLLKTPYVLTYIELWNRNGREDVQVYLTRAGVMLAMTMFNIKDGSLLREMERGVFVNEDCPQDIQSPQFMFSYT